MWFEYRPYVSVGERRRKAQAYTKKLQKLGRKISPVEIQGRKIATSFWGKAWCENLESYSDFENRLPRGRTYVRNGSVIDLQIKPGKVEAMVSGSEIYKITIEFKPLARHRWQSVKQQCAGQIASVVELLQGKLSDAVMRILTDRESGLFPAPDEIKLGCSCPDWADMCKHVAAVLYGVGSRLDHEPELFFTLRQVDQAELIEAAGRQMVVAPAGDAATVIADEDLADVFGIDVEPVVPAAAAPAAMSSASVRVSGAKSAKAVRSAGSAKSTKAKLARQPKPKKAKTGQSKSAVKLVAAPTAAKPARARKPAGTVIPVRARPFVEQVSAGTVRRRARVVRDRKRSGTPGWGHA